MEQIINQCVMALEIPVNERQLRMVRDTVGALENIIKQNKERNKHLNRNVENEDFFLCDEDKPITRKIGHVLNSVGGKDVMQLAFYVLSNKLRLQNEYVAGTMQMLDLAWDGIGEWRG